MFMRSLRDDWRAQANGLVCLQGIQWMCIVLNVGAAAASMQAATRNNIQDECR